MFRFLHLLGDALFVLESALNLLLHQTQKSLALVNFLSGWRKWETPHISSRDLC